MTGQTPKKREKIPKRESKKKTGKNMRGDQDLRWVALLRI